MLDQLCSQLDWANIRGDETTGGASASFAYDNGRRVSFDDQATDELELEDEKGTDVFKEGLTRRPSLKERRKTSLTKEEKQRPKTVSREDSIEIFLLKRDHCQFQGACFDTGAQKSVIGKQQAEADCSFAAIPFKLAKQ